MCFIFLYAYVYIFVVEFPRRFLETHSHFSAFRETVMISSHLRTWHLHFQVRWPIWRNFCGRCYVPFFWFIASWSLYLISLFYGMDSSISASFDQLLSDCLLPTPQITLRRTRRALQNPGFVILDVHPNHPWRHFGPVALFHVMMIAPHLLQRNLVTHMLYPSTAVFLSVPPFSTSLPVGLGNVSKVPLLGLDSFGIRAPTVLLHNPFGFVVVHRVMSIS